MLNFSMDSPEVACIAENDSALKRLIDVVGPIQIPLETDYFQSIASSIISQQLSAKAAQTILNRVLSVCEELTPARIQEAADDDLLHCGMSKAKLSYLRNLSTSVLTGELSFESLQALTDEEVIAQLTKVKGIGRWTAEMFLIFSLGRKDVFSRGDASLQRAMNWLYQSSLDANDITRLCDKWRPFRTVASLYLWEAIDKGYINSVLLASDE